MKRSAGGTVNLMGPEGLCGGDGVSKPPDEITQTDYDNLNRCFAPFNDKVARLTFPDLLTAFAAAVEANDGEGLASLFTEDGTYEDGFFGAHTGRPAIAVMLQRFHDTGRGLPQDWGSGGDRR